MSFDDKFSCPPQYSDWEGYHAVPLKCYDEETAMQLAELYGSNAFFCEYHECWHLGRAYRKFQHLNTKTKRSYK